MNTSVSYNNSTNTRPRITWLDMAKGYGIIFIILGHVSIIYRDVFVCWLNTFHVPLFFLLSGYVFSTKSSFGVFFKRKCKTMLIPYFCLGIILSIGSSILDNHGYPFGQIFPYNCAMLVAQIRYGTIWFLACLFMLNLIFYGVVKLLKTNLRIAICTVIFAVLIAIYYKIGGPSLPWNIDTCFAVFPFFFVGYFCKQYQEPIKNKLDQKGFSILMFILLLVINMGVGLLSFILSKQSVDLFFNQYGITPLFYISAFAGIGWVVILSRWFVLRPIRYIGEHSLLYFALHQGIFLPLSVMLLGLLGMHPTEYSPMGTIVIFVLLQVVITLVLLTLLHQLFSKTKLRFMIGK